MSHRMQQFYGNNMNEHFVTQRDNDVYGQSFYSQYPNVGQPLSPQQSSTSDVEERNEGTNKTIKKKKQTKKKRKDPNEPQKPVSPYALFFRDTQNDIKKKLSNPSFGEISKVVAHMWETIAPELKEQYKRRAAAAKKEYLKQLAAYRAVQISHQTPIFHQTSIPFTPHSIQHQQYCPSSAIQQYNHFHYINPYSHDHSNQNYHQSYNPSYYSHPPSIDNHMPQYTDLTSVTNGHQRLNDKREENDFHWNQTASSSTQW